jgi:hypothetical protein
MPYNIGRRPPHEFIDIKFRNGQVRRNVKTDSWRFRAWDFESDWDIELWQKSTEGKKNSI